MEAILTVSDRLASFTALPVEPDAGRGWTAPATGGVGLYFDFGDETPKSSNSGDRLYDGFITATCRIKVPFNQGQGRAVAYAGQISELFRGASLTRDGATGSLECRKVRLNLAGRDGQFTVADLFLTFHRTVYH